nr:MAG TPA: hypothetical protein [Caudoviricetes sp.]
MGASSPSSNKPLSLQTGGVLFLCRFDIIELSKKRAWHLFICSFIRAVYSA